MRRVLYDHYAHRARGVPDKGPTRRGSPWQFLIESVSLSLVGGIIGSGLGLAITLLAGTQFEDGLSVSPLAVLLSAAFAILTAGVYPALRASRLAPVDALRA